MRSPLRSSRRSRRAPRGRAWRSSARLSPGRVARPRPAIRANRRNYSSRMPAVRAFDHVGITVSDLDAATAFFIGLGLELEGRTFVEGDFLDTVIGMHGARTEIVMLRAPGGGTAVELSSFISPD